MALPPTPSALNFALASALGHRAVRKLRATHLGAFFGIVTAALESEFDPFSAPNVTLQDYARTTPRQWIVVRSAVLGALEAAFPMIKEVYQRKMEIAARCSHNAKINLERYRVENALKRTKKPKAHSFEAEYSAQPVILQPQKAPRYRSQNTDLHARQVAKNSKPGTLLRD